MALEDGMSLRSHHRLLPILLGLSLALLWSPAIAAQEVTLASVLVPKEKSPHGEVRLLKQDEAIVLQTRLHSKILKRVLGAIARKEKRFWKGSPEEKDSQLYITALKKGYAEIWERFRVREDRDNRYQELLIEFGVSEKDVWLEVARPEFGGIAGEFKILSREPLQRLTPARSYMLGSLFEISRDALGFSETELLKLLETSAPLFDWLDKEWTELQKKDITP